MKLRQRTFWLVLTIVVVAWNCFAQEPSPQLNAAPASAQSSAPASSGPSAALRDLLAAACSQNQIEFAKLLTTRNQEAFSRMTPSARVALMKRFVLLNAPGKASSSMNPSGRPMVRCETPSVTTEMQIGGAEVRDNLAFLPMELRDATDSTSASIRQITLGLVREQGEWKLLSIGVLFLDLPALEAEWDEAGIEGTERNSLEAMKAIASAIENYRNKFGRLPESLANLGPPLRGAPSNEAAGLLDSDLANGLKNGYAFRYAIVGASNIGAPAKYELAATPLRYGRTGKKSFFRDSNGGLHAADRQGGVGSASDPRAE
jgi:hypothetical protein